MRSRYADIVADSSYKADAKNTATPLGRLATLTDIANGADPEKVREYHQYVLASFKVVTTARGDHPDQHATTRLRFYADSVLWGFVVHEARAVNGQVALDVTIQGGDEAHALATAFEILASSLRAQFRRKGSDDA